jgi:hypothetical protein
MRFYSAVAVTLALVVPATARASDPTTSPPPPYAIPAPGAPNLPQLPLVAALALPGHQSLRSVLARGLAIELTAYGPVTLRVDVLLPQATAKRLGLRGDSRALADRIAVAHAPGVYDLRLRLNRRAAQRMRRLPQVKLTLRSVLSASAGRSVATSTITLPRG